MILLDTNIISEMMKPNPAVNVSTWLDQQEIIQLFITTITIAEISYGLAALPNGQRRTFLEEAFNKAILEAFKYRILNFDEPAAHLYGRIMGQRKKQGRPLSIPDGQILAIACSQKSLIATRNIQDFIDSGADLINPFERN
jgi:predicted nucleic acid-binding protein